MRATDKVSGQATADGIAAGASFLCLVHCLALPVAIAMFPSLAGILGFPEETHAILFLFAVPTSSFATVAGLRRHGLWLPVILAALGLCLIGVGAFAGFRNAFEVGLTVTGSVLLAAAHYRNWQAGRCEVAE